jgi:hypothetical protein
MILGLGQDEEPVEPDEEPEPEPEPEPAPGHPGHHGFRFPFIVREPRPYPVYVEAPDEGLQIGDTAVPVWTLVLGIGLLAGYVVGGRA